ncbi:hypothetical protein OI76_00130, partial [Listeria monocytogenes]
NLARLLMHEDYRTKLSELDDIATVALLNKSVKEDNYMRTLKFLQKHVMTATSYMIPFVVAGGLLFALSVMLSAQAAVPDACWFAKLNQIGPAGLALFISLLSGYIAFSIASKPGLAPGMIGAYFGIP